MTNLEDALMAVDAGADAVGFVFYEKSPRCVSVERAKEIVKQLPGKVDKVGVFVNDSPERVSRVADEVGFTTVQFHGDEYKNPKEYSLGGKTLFCMPVTEILQEMRGRSSFLSLPHFPNDAGILLDSGNQQERGGTGRTFAWGEAHGFISALKKTHPVAIAGGLVSSNVGWAIEYLRPWGVDVVSGVEAAPGKKDPEKVLAFVRAVREIDRKVG
jgi:phosphoribosylanthranilate isomerase